MDKQARSVTMCPHCKTNNELPNYLMPPTFCCYCGRRLDGMEGKMTKHIDLGDNIVERNWQSAEAWLNRCKEQEFCCYHITTKDRLKSILRYGLRPNSKPNWFTRRTHYVMLSLYPYWVLIDENESPILIEIKDPAIKREYFNDPEGIRWPYAIEPKYFRAIIEFKVIKESAI